MKRGLAYLRRKKAKGREYLYFDTGRRDEAGKRILTRLPDHKDPDFGDSYARALGARNRRASHANYLSVDELIRRFEKSPEFSALAESSKRSYVRYLAMANKLLRTARGTSPPAAQIEPRDIVRIRDELADRPGAANQTVRAVGALYAWASNPAQGHVPSNPTAKVTLFKPGEHQPWPDRLLEAGLADPQVALAVALLYFTGQRIGDVVQMQWRDIDRSRTEIAVFAQKTKTKLKLPIARELGDLLRAAPRNATAILTSSDGRPWTINGLRQKLQTWAKAQGEAVVPHGLRKNAVNALLEAGCTAAEVSAITAHSLQMIEHYAKGRNQQLIGRAAIVKLDEARKRRNEA